MKKRITGLFAATLLALSMMAVPAMADGYEVPPANDGVCDAYDTISTNPGDLSPATGTPAGQIYDTLEEDC